MLGYIRTLGCGEGKRGELFRASISKNKIVFVLFLARVFVVKWRAHRAGGGEGEDLARNSTIRYCTRYVISIKIVVSVGG